MTPKTPETNVDAGTLPAPDRGSFSLDVEERTIPISIRDWIGRLRTGDPGALPSVLGLVVLGLIFMQVSDAFLTQYNIGNLPGQGAYIAVIAMGLVFVLLLGEIDLSAGTAGGVAAGIAAIGIFHGQLNGQLPDLLYWSLVVGLALATLLAAWLKAWTGAVVVAVGLVLVMTNLTQHVIPGIIAAVCIGAAIGVLNGYLVAKVGIPSFVVTLALFLAWQGVVQFALKGQPVPVGEIGLWHDLTYGTLSVLWSWVFVLVLVGGYLLYTVYSSVSAKRAGLAHDALALVLLRGGILALVAIVITILASDNRGLNRFRAVEGIPVPAAVVITLMVLCTLLLTKTTWGRHLYAVGGNEEAARRAGIDVVHMKVTAFILCSSFGAFGVVLLSSYQSSASLDLGAGNTLLFSVAAAVIGGTSLFGGRGKPRDAVIGALVIVIIPNGLLLRPSLDAQWQQVITGIVLLLAAAIDAISRKRAKRG